MGAAQRFRGGFLRGRAVGRGSTATVYLATSTTTSASPLTAFAVKSAELPRSAPLQREHNLMSSLCSPYLVNCLGSDVTTEPNGKVFFNLLMEYVPGGTLAEEIKRRPAGLDESSIQCYTRGILRGLACLHSKGIAHCDVKGQNILVRADDGRVKLADLGCARRVAGRGDAGSNLLGGGRTGLGGVVIGGTPLYMAPEVARGEEQGTAADVWALGCTVLEMATGGPPWPGVADPVAAIHRIAFSADVPELPCNVSHDARDFLGRCLKRDPGERWSAERLLGHPFVKHWREEGEGEADELITEGCITPDEDNNKKRNVSPNSTLKQGIWDSCLQEEEEAGPLAVADTQVDGRRSESPEERLRHLICGGGGSAWDDSSWIPVRTGAASCSGESPSV